MENVAPVSGPSRTMSRNEVARHAGRLAAGRASVEASGGSGFLGGTADYLITYPLFDAPRGNDEAVHVNLQCFETAFGIEGHRACPWHRAKRSILREVGPNRELANLHGTPVGLEALVGEPLDEEQTLDEAGSRVGRKRDQRKSLLLTD